MLTTEEKRTSSLYTLNDMETKLAPKMRHKKEMKKSKIITIQMDQERTTTLWALSIQSYAARSQQDSFVW